MHDERGVVERATERFHDRFGAAPAVRAAAPGRVNLVGGHVDYNDGTVLPVAIDRETVVAARPRGDGVVRARSAALDAEFEAPIGADRDDWGAYVLGTATVLTEEAGLDAERIGADLLVGGDVPMGAGLSSSAALEVGVAGALDALYDLDLSRETLAEVCWRAENEEVGMACGVMDQLTSAAARPGYALHIDCRTRGIEHIPFDDDRASVLVVDTNVAHELTDSGFNDRVAECHGATAALDAAMGKRVRALRDVTPEEAQAHADALDPVQRKRARHVTTEMRRVEAAADALRAGHLETVGSLMRESHRSLREDYEVSCEELDVVVEALAGLEGVFGARMVGGGWGGSVVALVEPERADAVAAAVTERYAAATGNEGDAYVLAVGEGLRVG
jgi:galactokinase